MDFNEKQRQERYELTQKADEVEIQECRDAINAESEKLRKIREDAYKRGKEVQKFNATYKDVAKGEGQSSGRAR